MPAPDPAAPTHARGPLTAADLMTPGPRSGSPFSTAAEAAMLLRDEGTDALPVLDAGKPVGLLTARALVEALPDRPGLASLPVSEIMGRDITTVERDAPLDLVRAAFADGRVEHVLVVDPHGDLAGIIARSSLASRFPVAEAAGHDTPAGDPPARPAPGSSRNRPDGRSPWTDPKALWGLLKQAGSEWVEDKAPRLGAALAYYTIFSVAPLLLIALSIAGLAFNRQAVQGQLVGQLRNLIGVKGAEGVEAMLESASRPEAGYTASGVGIVLLLVGAMGLFGQLQDAMNTVWEVQPKPGRGLWAMVRDRLMSLSMVMGTAFLLLVSLVVSSALAAMGSLFGDAATGVIGLAVTFVVSFAVVTGLFAMIFRYLPDAEIAWGDVWLGAAITSLLFAVGKLAIGLYLGHSSVASAYGAAGSLVVFLVWAYYSAQIFLFGAEFTQAYANRYGSRIVPEPGAIAATEEARAQQGLAPRPEATAGAR